MGMIFGLHQSHILTICPLFSLVHRRDSSRGDGISAVIVERLEHGVYNFKFEFLTLVYSSIFF